MDTRNKVRHFVFLVIGIMILIFNYQKLDGIENIRGIHIATLVGIGIAFGILLKNVIDRIKKVD